MGIEEKSSLQARIDKEAFQLARQLQTVSSNKERLDLANKLSLLVLAALTDSQSRAQQIINRLRT